MAANEGLPLPVFWLSFYVLLASSINCTATDFTEEMVTEWANNIGKEVYQYTKNITHVEELQKSYEALNLSTTVVDWKQLLKETKKNIEGYFDKKITTLKNIVNKAEDAYCMHKVNNDLKKGDIKFPDTKDLDGFLNKSGIKLQYNNVFQQDVTFNNSVVHVPTDVYDGAASIVNGIKWSEALDAEFSKNAKADPSLKWQYFASNTGFTRFYPGHKWKEENDQVDLYDARTRSWFIQGATSPKDIVIILDASGSMRGVPMSLAKLSAKALIDTFEENDYFNVLMFNKEAEILVCSDQLIQATKKNKQVAKEIIDKSDKLQGENMAKWKMGVEKAFKLLEKSRESGNTSKCQQAIMIFSDGTTNNLEDVFNENNKDRMVRVFTFPVGPPAESTTAMLQMSKQNRGYFSRIQSVGAVRSVSEPYIQVLSRPMARAPKANLTKSTVWTGAYLDAMGLGMMVTGTLPAFYRPTINNNCSKAQKKHFDHLIGVAGIDIPLINLNEFFVQPLMGDNGYALVVNNNGLVAYHPRLKTVYGYLPDAPGVDLIDAEFPLDKENLMELRNSMVDKTFMSSTSNPVEHSFDVYDISTDELRVIKRKLHFYVDSLQGTSFSFGIASPKLGFKYKLQSNSLLSEINTELNSTFLSLEKWNYCEGTFSANNPVEYLKTKDFSKPSSKFNNDMVNGLAVDLKATSTIPKVWEVDTSGLKSVFVRTHFGVTKRKPCSSCSGDDDYKPNQKDVGRVSSYDQQSVVYTSPYNQGRRERNSSSVIALQKVVLNNQTVAVTGYEMQSSSFEQLLVDKTKKCSSNKCADVNCDRGGKNVAEGLYCYLLDENAFVVSSNTKKSSGVFFGKVDHSIMSQLMRHNDSTATGFYNKITFTDYQAVCEQKAGISSAGTSLFATMFSVSSYVDWWTTKAWWFFAYFNFYSWMMSETKSFTVASEDKPKNQSCIKKVTTYYANNSNVLQNGSTQLGNCVRDFIVKSVPQSNLYLVVVDAECGLNKHIPRDMDLPGEPKDSNEVIKCQSPLHRKRPQRCFTSNYPESEYPPGYGSRVGPSIVLIILMITSSLLMKNHV